MTISISYSKRGTEKTTTSVNISAALAHQDNIVPLIDADVYSPGRRPEFWENDISIQPQEQRYQ